MNVITLRSEGLAHLSYIVHSQGKAVIIDPRRDVDEYLEILRREHLDLLFILETHRNEDYVSGAWELLKRTGVRAYHGEQSPFRYGAPIRDGHILGLGEVRIRAMHTPGHTMESFCYLMEDDGGPLALFTGDTLFVGEVGRTDLGGIHGPREMAERLYESLHGKILDLDDGVLVFPGHGAGSMCGHEIAERETTTIGLERARNPMLGMDKEAFLAHKLSESMDRPPYFQRMEEMNRDGAPVLSSLTKPKRMTPDDLFTAIEGNALVVDVRSPQSFCTSHIPRSWNLPREGIPSYGGATLIPQTRIVLVAEEEKDVMEVVRHLRRMGFDNVLGYLRGGMESWMWDGRSQENVHCMGPSELAQEMSVEGVRLVDVRTKEETETGMIPGAIHVPLSKIRDGWRPRDDEGRLILYCSTGHRASTAASIIKSRGANGCSILLGGLLAWTGSGMALE